MAQINTKNDLGHPGAYVRQHVIPKEMTVTKVAAILGVGRPALSNFLNGKASLSPEMAKRLEETFEVDRKMLLDMQARFSRGQEAERGQSVAAGAYAPALAPIKARDIQCWPQDNIHARQELAALLRRLIHSTGRDLTPLSSIDRISQRAERLGHPRAVVALDLEEPVRVDRPAARARLLEPAQDAGDVGRVRVETADGALDFDLPLEGSEAVGAWDLAASPRRLRVDPGPICSVAWPPARPRRSCARSR